MEKRNILKQLENRKKMFEDYLRKIKAHAGKQGPAKNTPK